MKKMKILILTLILTLVPVFNSYAAVWENVEVVMNGTKQDFTITVTEVGGHIMVPIRPVFEMFNFKVHWNNMRQRINTTTALGSLIIDIGSVFVCQNDYQAYVLSTYPRIYKGSTMIPLDFAADATDTSIQFVETSNSLVVNENE
jgi:hypothetical protein